MSGALLAAEKLGRRFGGLKAVDGVDLQLMPNEIVGVIGPNGAGKTTLFSLLAGSIAPSEGRVLIDGKEVHGPPAHRTVRAGVVRTHQIVRPFHGLTVRENAIVAAEAGAGDRAPARTARARAVAALEFVGLGDRMDDAPAALTLAGRKKLELARALATEPRALLLDEVIAGVNPAEALEMAKLVRRVRDERGVAILIIEHVLAALMALSQRVIVLDAGKKIAEGLPADVVRNPLVIEAYLGKSGAAHQPPPAGAAT